MSAAKLSNLVLLFIFAGSMVFCSRNRGEIKEEQIRVVSSGGELSTDADSLANSIRGNVSLNNIATMPDNVILTGLSDHRLITVYKSREQKSKGTITKYFSSYNDNTENDGYEHFMPGIDILYGYNLLNIAHYDLKSENLNFFFAQPALIKTLYYPSFLQDSLNKMPVNRDYYFVSVYDEDTNKDTLINKKDLRRFYHFDAGTMVKTRIVPQDYSVIRSQYDPQNDVMYIFASHDINKNGTRDSNDPIHIFWVNLKSPGLAKRLY